MASYRYQADDLEGRVIGGVNWIGLWTLYLKEVRRFANVWQQTVLGPVVTTLLFMLIFSLALGGAGRVQSGVAFVDFLAPGLVMMALIQNAFQNPSSSILISKVQGNIVDVLMPPLSPGELVIGYVLGGITRGVAVGLAIYTTFWLWPGIDVGVDHWWAFFFFLVMGSTMLSLAGSIAGMWAEKFDHSAGLNNFVIVPLSLLSGTFYSIQRLPETFQTVSHFNPFFYLIDGFRYALIGHADSFLVAGVWGILMINVVLWIVTFSLFKAGYKLKP